MSETYKNCESKNAKEIVNEFYDYLLKTGYCSIQEFEYSRNPDETKAIPEMFTARIQTNTAKTNDSLIVCGNTALVEGRQFTFCLEEDSCAIDFDRIFVFKGNEVEDMKKHLEVLIQHWIDIRIASGDYYGEENEVELICKDMILWDDTQKWFPYYGDPKNAVCRYEKEWFSCREGFSTNTPRGDSK